jgi:hypothetical protein
MLMLPVLCAALSGCGSMVADTPLIGLPSDAPPRKPRGDFLPVHDLPGPRDSAQLDAAQQAKLRADLAAAREEQAKAAAAAK